MKKEKIAIITGATGGLGREFVKVMCKEEVSEIWCIARNQEKLAELKQEYGKRIVAFSMDLSQIQAMEELEERLKNKQPTISYLINNAGIGKLGSYQSYCVSEVQSTIAINCTAVASLCTMCIPYMQAGSHILNMASQAAFQPNPYINLYSAGKAFVRSYTRALNVELEETGITATAVCPGWVKTELIMKKDSEYQKKIPGLVEPEPVVALAMKDAKAGKDMSVCTLNVKYMHLLAKVLPQKRVMKYWVRRIKKYF